MAEGSVLALQEKCTMSTGQSKKRFRVLETTFSTEEIEDVDSPEELLLPDEHPALRDGSIRKWLSTSTTTLTEDECEGRQCVATKDAGIFSRVKVTSGCMCKLFVVIYLLGCLLISTLYIVIYGPNELYLVPETSHKTMIKPKPNSAQLLHFYDTPYTEWLAQRWTYDSDPFADWPALPEYINSIQQTASGTIDTKQGVWLLDSQGLYFMYNINLETSDETVFVNISDNLDMNIHESMMICPGGSRNSLFIVSPDNVTQLNCSPSAIDYCDISAHWATPELNNVASATVSGSDGHLWIGTDHGLYRLNTAPSQHPMEMANSDEPAFLVDDSNDDSNLLDLVVQVEGPIISLAWRGGLMGPSGWGLDGSAFLFTNASHFYPQNISYGSSYDWHSGSGNAPDDFGLLVIGTPNKIYFYDGHVFWFEWASAWEDNVGGVIDGPPVSLTFVPTGELFIGTNASLSRLNIDYTFDRIGDLEGLPYHHIISLRYSPYSPSNPSSLVSPSSIQSTTRGTLWVGTKKGYSLFDIGGSRFVGYFYGPRWHPGSSILSMSGTGSTTVLITDEGMSVIVGEEWTLEKKAKHYQKMLHRHVREPGLVADCPLSDYTPSSCSPGPNDNNGLWTSWLVAAEAFRYKATGDPQALENGWKFYQAMKFLVDVTGVRGLPARSVLKIKNVPSKGEDYGESGWAEEATPSFEEVLSQVGNLTINGSSWHVSTTKPDWIWKGDTSSDEIVGHIFASTVAYDMLASSPSQRQEVADTLDSIMGYIKDNNYTLVDVTNVSTRWGVWSPSAINLNQSWADERGLNSLQILSGLLSAYRITGKMEYLEAWKELFNGSRDGEPCHYGLNIINQKITFPQDVNYSDDELAFLPYFVYFQTLKQLRNTDRQFKGREMFFIPTLSLNKAWRSVRAERSAAWNAIYGNITGEDSLTDDIVWSLRNWPLELVQWNTNNSHRLDIQFRRGQDRFSRSNSQSVRVLSPRERTQLRWNGNPYQLDSVGSSNEMDPGPWLMSYWLAKWNRLL